MFFSLLKRPLVGPLLKSLSFVVGDSTARGPPWARQKWKRPCGFQLHPGILGLGLLTNLSLPVSCLQPWLKNRDSGLECCRALPAGCLRASCPSQPCLWAGCWELWTSELKGPRRKSSLVLASLGAWSLRGPRKLPCGSSSHWQ